MKKGRIIWPWVLVFAAVFGCVLFCPSDGMADEIVYRLQSGDAMIEADTVFYVSPGQKIVFSAESKDIDITMLGYYWNRDDLTTVNGTTVTITMPNGAPGEKKTLMVSAAGWTQDHQTYQSPWEQYTLVYEGKPSNTKLVMTMNGEILDPQKEYYSISYGTRVTVTAEEPDDIEGIYYKWDESKSSLVKNVKSFYVDLKGEIGFGQIHTIGVWAQGTDGTAGELQEYRFIIDETPQVSAKVVMDGKEITPKNTYTVKGGEKIEVTAKSTAADIAFTSYYFWENGEVLPYTRHEGGTLQFTLPEREAGSVLYMFIEAVGSNDMGEVNTITKTGWLEFRLVYVEDAAGETKQIYHQPAHTVRIPF